MSNACEQLARRIDDRSAVVGVIGLGYVGLPLVRSFHGAGLRVLGLDTDPAKIDALRAGRSYIEHIRAGDIAAMVGDGRFTPTGDFKRLEQADAILVCVPTPLGDHREPDLSYVEQTTRTIARHLRDGQLIVLESTTYPGTTRGVMQPLLEVGGKRAGTDFHLAYSPEREDPGRADFSTRTIPKLVGGIDPASTELAAVLYRLAIDKVIAVSSAEVAEAAKLLENIYRAVNIAMVNEMKVLLTELGVDVWEVIDAAATKPFGFQRFTPGPGLGGHCIPIDPFYLTWRAREVGLPTRFIELAGEVNHAMPEYVVQRTVRALNDRGVALRGARMLVLGLAYKPNVDDVRESPALVLIEKLQQLGAVVSYHDPHVPQTHKMRHHDLKMTSIDWTPHALGEYDGVLIATDHDWYDWQAIAEHAKLVIDTRGAMRKVTGRRDHIVSA